jgi:hypothetical protein
MQAGEPADSTTSEGVPCVLTAMSRPKDGLKVASSSMGCARPPPRQPTKKYAKPLGTEPRRPLPVVSMRFLLVVHSSESMISCTRLGFYK